MAVTQTDLDRLNAAIASEERQVTIGSQTTIYRSTADLMKARDDVVRQLAEQAATAAGKANARRTLLQYGGRGY
jgi:hypothetical protein